MENKHVFYDGNYEWIQVDQQDAKSVMALQKQYHLSDEMLTYSLDKTNAPGSNMMPKRKHCCWFSMYLSKKSETIILRPAQ